MTTCVLNLLHYLHWDILHSKRGHAERVFFTYRTIDVLAKYHVNYITLCGFIGSTSLMILATVSKVTLYAEKIGWLK